MTRIQHDSPKKNRLVGAIQAGKTIPQAAEIANIPYGTAKKIWRNFCTTGSTKNQPRSGRPPKVTERLGRKIVREARKNRRMPFKEIGNHVKPALSETTVRDYLARAGYHRRVARKVPYLSKVQKKNRLKWGHNARGTDWSKVIWSDESYVYLGDSHGRTYVMCRADEVFEEDCLIPSFKQSSIRVMVWGCIMKDRRGPLVVLEYPGGKGGGMNAKRYREQVLDPILAPFYGDMRSARGVVKFQQDGAPSHKAKTTLKWFDDHAIPLFPHPPSSPDLNPIEPVWHELKTRLRNRAHHPSSVTELITAVQEVWEEIGVEDVNKYINHMDNVVEAVMKAKGGHTEF